MRISKSVHERCPDDWKVSVAWPNDSELVARCLAGGRYSYQTFAVTTETETADAITAWAHGQHEAPSGSTS